MGAPERRPDDPAASDQASTANRIETWYAARGRHHLPWRHTRDPWAVLVSEVMLQQTATARVLPRWSRFLERWPSPALCAAAELADVLREWDGLGYPRRASALWRCAAVVAEHGWPEDEAGLRRLPGVGAYTARALLCLAFDRAAGPPRDVNLGRVAARCWLGRENGEGDALDAELIRHRPPTMAWRDYTLALFDLGATRCQARSVSCGECPLAQDCRSRERLATGVPARPRRQPPYAGSMRELRGAVLRALLADPWLSLEQLRAAVAATPAAGRPGAVAQALAGLRRDGLVTETAGTGAASGT